MKAFIKTLEMRKDGCFLVQDTSTLKTYLMRSQKWMEMMSRVETFRMNVFGEHIFDVLPDGTIEHKECLPR